MRQRNEKGQFVYTNGGQRYKIIQYKNKRISEHTLVVLRSIGLESLPDGFVVHHLDGNKKNNDIHNLALITITAHNRIHSHVAWNKGISASTSKKWGLAVAKQARARKASHLPVCKKAFDLQLNGKRLREIAAEMGTSRRQVSDRIRAWKIHVGTSVSERALAPASRVL
jgi:hypothetical protein